MKTRIYRSKKYPKRVKRGQGTKRTRRFRSKNRKTLRRQASNRRHKRRTRKKKRTQTGGFGAIKAAGAAALGAAAGAAVLGVGGGAAALGAGAGAAVGLGIGQGKCVCRGCLGCGQREQKVTYQCRSYNHAGYHGENGGWIQTPNGLLCGLCKGTPIGHKMMIGAILNYLFSDADTELSQGSSTDCGSRGNPCSQKSTRKLKGGAVDDVPPNCTEEEYLSNRPCSGGGSRCCLICSDNLHTESNGMHVDDCYGCRPAGHAGDPLCSARDMAMKYGLSPTVSVPEGHARLGRIDRFDKVRADYEEIRRVMIAQEERRPAEDSITFSELKAPALKAAESVSQVLSSFGLASGSIEGVEAGVAADIYQQCVSTLISPPNAGPEALREFLLKVYERMAEQLGRDRDRGPQTDSRLRKYRDKFRDLVYR